MPDGVNIPGGPSFVGLPQPPDVPCDPTGDGWRGPQGFPGQTGPQGGPGAPGVPGTGSYSVQDAAFGAVGDGTTNDAIAIQAAINAAAGHGPLRFPATQASGSPAIYLIRSTLLVPSNSRLIIEAGATIQIGNGANSNCFGFPYHYNGATTPVSNVLIELYGTLDGNRTNNTSGGGIVTLGSGVAGVTNTIADIYVRGERSGLIHNFANWAVSISCCTNGEVSGITMDSCGSSTEFTGNDNNGNVYSYNVGFSDCIVSNINDLGCGLYGGVQKGFVRNCEIFGCSGCGAFIFSDSAQALTNSDCEVTGCVLHDNEAAGVNLASNMLTTYNLNSVVRGNRIYNNNGTGISISQSIGVLAEGNYIHDNNYKNIRFSRLNMSADICVSRSSSRVSIIGNLILNPQVQASGGPVAAAGVCYGIALDQSNYCHIMGNRIADFQTTKTMTAAIGGNWGANGSCIGNSYGPRINTIGNFPADMSLYQTGSVQGINYDTVTGYISGLTQLDDIHGNTGFPPKGLTVGINYDGRNEVDFLVGADGQSPLPGGFDFIKTHWPNVHINSGTNTGGNISLTTNTAHGVSVGDLFNVSAASGVGGDIQSANGKFTAAAGTGGTTLNYTIAAVLDVQSISGGNINHMILDGGVIDTTAGVNGSLLANDGFGNTRLGGALVHGAMQTWGTLTNAGTVTVSANTSMVLIRNSASIASAAIVLPAPTASAYVAGTELELNFQNPVGALTVTAASGATVVNPPTAIAVAGASANFVNSGSIWLRRIAI